MTAPTVVRPTDAVMADLLADVRAKQVQNHHRRPGLDVAWLEAWVRSGPARWHLTAAGRQELARLTGAACQICGAVSLDPECARCAVGEETAWKRRQDI